MKERHVEIYRYKAITNNNELTTDQKIEKLALQKYKLINTFLTLVKQAAVDCQLFKNVNMLKRNINVLNLMKIICLIKILDPHIKKI